jgi:hypothetical protein
MYDWRLYDVGGAVSTDIFTFLRRPRFVRSEANVLFYFGLLYLAWTSEHSFDLPNLPMTIPACAISARRGYRSLTMVCPFFFS